MFRVLLGGILQASRIYPQRQSQNQVENRMPWIIGSQTALSRS